MLEKFKSRKFLMTLLSGVVGILTLFGVADGTTELVYSIGMIIIPTVVYILTEGKIDANSVKQIINTVDQIVDKIEEEDDKNEK